MGTSVINEEEGEKMSAKGVCASSLLRWLV